MARLSGPRRQVLARLAKHGSQYEQDCCTRMLGAALAADGHVARHAVPGIAVSLTITELGRAQLNPAIDACGCRSCRKDTK